jgi:hypothetical protein
MTPLRVGVLGAAAGGLGTLAVVGAGILVHDRLTDSPTSVRGTCNHAEYVFSLSVLNRAVLGEVVINEPDNLDERDPNPNWLVRWPGKDEEQVRAEGLGSPVASSFRRLGDLDDGGTRSVWIRRTDQADWCKLAASLE